MTPRRFSKIAVTGGAGFIGSHFIRWALHQPDFKGRVLNIDALTYAGNPESLSDVATHFSSRYELKKVDITQARDLEACLREFDPDLVVHFAAESHVDRSIHGPAAFIQANVMGTFHLLECLRHLWKGRDGVLFHHVSTDEVFGSLGATGYFNEETAYDPKSPYSASKASSDHLVRAFGHTFGLPFTLSNCSNNYGPYQFPEKLIPVMIENILSDRPLPVYGEGLNVRDWLHVEDHVAGIWKIVSESPLSKSWLLGGGNEWTNLKLVHELCAIGAAHRKISVDVVRALIRHVTDRPGHDHRYAIDASRIKNELGWAPKRNFEMGLRETFAWYVENRPWVERVKSGAYRDWMKTHYK